MATAIRGCPGIPDRAVAPAAGIRPYKLDLRYTNAAGDHAEFLAAKSADGYNSGSAEEGDFYYDSTNDVIQMYTTSWGEAAKNPPILEASTTILAAAVKTLNATPVVVLDHSALVTAGICASGDALIFHGAIINEYGGTTDYDQDGDCVIEYTTGPVVVSLTLDDFFNDGTDGSIATMKPLATDLAYNQVLIDEDLEIKMSASPFSAAGDRNAKVTVYYSVFTPA